jgi:uncharacterized membrane protein
MNDHDTTPPTSPGDASAPRQGRRSPLRVVLALAVLLAGIVWMLQGLGILTAGRSFMIGDPLWTSIGAAMVVLGLVLAIRARRG